VLDEVEATVSEAISVDLEGDGIPDQIVVAVEEFETEE